jgi:hypothetical protein
MGVARQEFFHLQRVFFSVGFNHHMIAAHYAQSFAEYFSLLTFTIAYCEHYSPSITLNNLGAIDTHALRTAGALDKLSRKAMRSSAGGWES